MGVMRRLVLVLACLAAATAALPSVAGAKQEVTVASWIRFELDSIAANRVNPPRAARALGLVSRSMFEASELGGSGRDEAVAGAASTMLAYLFPGDAARAAALAAPARASRPSAFAAGEAVARRLIARAETDGSSTPWTGTVPVGPGLWVPTPPGFVFPPLEPLAGTWRTWNLGSGSQFRPPPPPAFGSAEFAAELAEVYAVSQSLTAEQRAIALLWADGAGTVTPAGHWNLIALDLVEEVDYGTRKAAELFAALNTAQADAFIACWDAKYTYWSIRPISAIRDAIDPTWTSVIVTPPFPSYVSGHSSTSGAASTVLAGYFPLQAGELSALADEAAISRLYGGIHFRSDNEAGLELGRRVGAVALDAYR
jgi:membrane-associated phospholipid phosphatase